MSFRTKLLLIVLLTNLRIRLCCRLRSHALYESRIRRDGRAAHGSAGGAI